MLKKLLLVAGLFLMFGSNQTKAQKYLLPADRIKLEKVQDSLETLSDSISNGSTSEIRNDYNNQFVKKLVESLKTPYSFTYGFDSLKNISILRSPQHNFRLITWYVPQIDGNYKFYGAIQMNIPNGQLKLFPLTDLTNEFGEVNTATNANKWYGARYFDLIPVTFTGKPTYYILLGWKGSSDKTAKKLLDVLSFENGEPVFGKKVFETTKNAPLKYRVVFEYNRQNNMTLFYDKTSRDIVFDHLAPFEPEYKGNFEFYGSDLSFDAYEIGYAKLKLKEDIDLKNVATETDELYVPPVKASKVILKKQ